MSAQATMLYCAAPIAAARRAVSAEGHAEADGLGIGTDFKSNTTIRYTARRLRHSSRAAGRHKAACGSLKWPTTTIGTGGNRWPSMTRWEYSGELMLGGTYGVR